MKLYNCDEIDQIDLDEARKELEWFNEAKKEARKEVREEKKERKAL